MWTHGFFLQISKSLSLTEHNVNPKEIIFIHITNDYYLPTNGFHTYLSSRSISINSNMSIHLSSSGMWRANMDTGSSQSILQPRMSDSFRAWTCRDWLGTRAHWWGFKHCTLSLGGNCSKRRKQLGKSEKCTVIRDIQLTYTWRPCFTPSFLMPSCFNAPY